MNAHNDPCRHRRVGYSRVIHCGQAGFPAELAPASDHRIERVPLFTGHRIDSAKRPEPRFPAAKENIAREVIHSAVSEEKAIANGPMLAVSGGANGGDILFLEVCDELPTE
jgi:hypothetical protein